MPGTGCLIAPEVSQKKELTLNHWTRVVFKTHPKPFMLTSTWNISILPTHLFVFSLGLNENVNSFFATRCRLWSGKIVVSPVTLYTKQHTALSGIKGEMRWKWDQSTNHCGLASRKGGVWKNEALSKSFESHWASKLKINAFYKTMNVFFDPRMSTFCWGLPKPNYEPFFNHNRGFKIKLNKK